MHLRQYMMAAALARAPAPAATTDKSHTPPQGQRLQAKRPKLPRNRHTAKPIRLRPRVVMTQMSQWG
jgi:hypothetical protein